MPRILALWTLCTIKWILYATILYSFKSQETLNLRFIARIKDFLNNVAINFIFLYHFIYILHQVLQRKKNCTVLHIYLARMGFFHINCVQFLVKDQLFFQKRKRLSSQHEQFQIENKIEQWEMDMLSSKFEKIVYSNGKNIHTLQEITSEGAWRSQRSLGRLTSLMTSNF